MCGERGGRHHKSPTPSCREGGGGGGGEDVNGGRRAHDHVELNSPGTQSRQERGVGGVCVGRGGGDIICPPRLRAVQEEKDEEEEEKEEEKEEERGMEGGGLTTMSN